MQIQRLQYFMTNEQHTSLRNKLKKQEELEKGKFLTGNLTGKKKEKKKTVTRS